MWVFVDADARFTTGELGSRKGVKVGVKRMNPTQFFGLFFWKYKRIKRRCPMGKGKDRPGRDFPCFIREMAASYYGFLREVTLDFLQLMRQAAIDGTKEFFAPLTGYCPRCEAEKKDCAVVLPMNGEYPDW
jgi:hypothetical protein